MAKLKYAPFLMVQILDIGTIFSQEMLLSK